MKEYSRNLLRRLLLFCIVLSTVMMGADKAKGETTTIFHVDAAATEENDKILGETRANDDVAESNDASAEADKNAVIVFQDPVVEARIREILSKDDGPVTVAEMKTIDVFAYYPIDDWFAENVTTEVFLDRSNSEPKIKTINDLAYCTNLKELILVGQPISNIDVLSEHAMLEKVILDGTRINDFTSVLALPTLKEFIVTQGLSNLLDISALNHTHNLETFYLRGATPSIDYSPLANHKKLKKVELNYVDTHDFTALVGNWPSLESLTVFHSNITSDDLSLLSTHSLTAVRFWVCPEISDLSPLTKQSGLVSLTAAWCNVVDVASLSELKSLEYIDLRYNPISDFSPLQELRKLTTLKK